MPNLVPLYEEMEAARFAGYTFKEWRQLPYEEKALHIAHYRLHRLVELHSGDAVGDEMEMRIKQAESKAASRRR